MTAEPRVSAPRTESGRARFEDFVASHWSSLVGFAVLLTNDRAVAPDIVQDVLAGMLQRWQSIDDPRSYAMVSVRNAARRARRRPLARDRSDVANNTDDVSMRAQATVDVRRALARLSRAQYETVVLRYYLGLTDREVATTLHRQLGTVKSQLRRALARLTKELDS